MQIRVSRAGRRTALAMLPLLVSGAALAWPQAHGDVFQGALAVDASPTGAATPPCPITLLCPTPSPSASPKPSPTPSGGTHHPPPPPPNPGGGGGGGGGGNPQPVPAPPAAVGPAFTVPPPASSGSLVGQSGGPPTPPAVPGTSMEITSDPSDPAPGTAVLVTVTISGSRGSDRYAVTGAPVTLELTEKPDSEAALSATSLTTDVSGSATSRLTLSKARGRHVVKASSGGLSNQLLVDTLSGARASTTRARHDGIVGQVKAPAVNPAYLVGAAVAILLVSFLLPYRRRAYALVRRPRQAPTGAGSSVDASPDRGAAEPVLASEAAAAAPWPVVPARASEKPARPATGRTARKPATASETPEIRPRTQASRAPGAEPDTAIEPKLSSARKTPRARRSAAPGA